MLLADRDHLVMYGVILFDFRRGRHEKLVSLDRARNGKEGVGMSPHPVVSIQVVAFRISPKIILKKYNICCIILPLVHK